MATVVAVMDRPSFDARTDNIVLVRPDMRELLWIPRDLWCDGLGRINVAYQRGGHEGLAAALATHGLEAEHGICLGREAVEAGLEGIRVTIPVREPLEFWYPLAPRRAIDEGRKRIRFQPPAEELSGERIHQWIGAKFEVGGPGGDLRRIERQQELLAVLLGEGFDFRRFLAAGLPVRVTSPQAIDEVATVEWTWSSRTLAGLRPTKIAGQKVLVRRLPSPD